MKKASEYDLEIPQSHTADLDQPTVPCGRAKKILTVTIDQKNN